MEKENNMATEISSAGKKTACVTGAAGYMASALVKKLLEEGYSVNATVRDPENQGKVSHLLNLPGSDRLKLFRGDLTVEGSFDDAVSDCDIVFHVATPVHFESKEPENDMIKPAIQGSVNVLRSCARVKSVKRVILTSSAAAVSINQRRENGQVMTEDDWTDVEYLTSEKPPTWGYPVSKTLAEKAAWKFAEENKIDLITILPVLMSGPSLTQEIPSSVCLALALLTGNEFLIEGLKHMQLLSGSISLVHVHDICRAQIFLAEKESASGRYICCPINTSVPELANFLADRYPQYKVPTEFGDFPAKPKLSICSQKLMKEGFSFKYGIEEMYDDSVEYLKAKGLLPK